MSLLRFAAVPAAISLLLLSSCSDAPQPAADKPTQKAKPAEPVSGLTALYHMFSKARQWAPDAQILRARSLALAEVKTAPGKSGAWEAIFVSASKGAAKPFTYSVVEAGGNLHEGVFAGVEESYSAARGPERPFPINALHTDTDKAYEIALKKGDYYAKEHPKMPISFVLEVTARSSDPTWRVVWGESVATSGFSILVNAASGEFVQALR